MSPLLTASIHEPEQLGEFAESPLYAGFDPQTLAFQHSDEHLICLRDGGPVARASLWWSDAPPLPGERVGAIGHYAALDDDAACGRAGGRMFASGRGGMHARRRSDGRQHLAALPLRDRSRD